MSRPDRDPIQATVLSLPVIFFKRKINFLVDSGAERSVVPRNVVPTSLLYPCDIKLTGVGGNLIDTFGKISSKIGVPGLRREFSVNFIASSVKPILGADFLTEHGLQLDMKQRCLRDPVTNITAQLIANTDQHTSIRVSETSHITPDILLQFTSLLLAPDYHMMPQTDITHVIHTNGPPLFCKPRPLSPAKLEVAKREFTILLEMGIVRPSSSPWASPLHMVKKSDGSWRPCGDYRRVNSVTIPDRYPVPNLQHFHHVLAGSLVFSKLDLVKAYHFIPVSQSDIEKTAICTPFGSFEYNRMPFGLRNSSGTFQRFIDSVLRDLPFALAYVDDILIFSRTKDEHNQHLKQVLSRLMTTGLRINGNKCQFSKNQVDFLSYNISGEGKKPPLQRIQALQVLPKPTDAKTLTRYLGMFGFYQRCIPHFANITTPLKNILKSEKFT